LNSQEATGWKARLPPIGPIFLYIAGQLLRQLTRKV
jgi:hypothetical protein